MYYSKLKVFWKPLNIQGKFGQCHFMSKEISVNRKEVIKHGLQFDYILMHELAHAQRISNQGFSPFWAYMPEERKRMHREEYIADEVAIRVCNYLKIKLTKRMKKMLKSRAAAYEKVARGHEKEINRRFFEIINRI